MALENIHWRIKVGAVNAVKALALPGDAIFGEIDQRVFSQLLPDESGLLFPCVILTTEGEKEEKLPGDSLNQRWRYPVRIWVADKESARRHEKEELYLTWRKAIIRIFDDQPFPAVPEAEGATIVPEVIFDPRLPQYQHIISGMVLWVSTTEER